MKDSPETSACKGKPDKAGCEEFSRTRLECIRQCYYASKGDPTKPTVAKSTYVCADDTGPADLGNRYIRLADMFGPQGISTNICGPDAMAVALDRIADRLLELTQP